MALISLSSLIMPYFVIDGAGKRQAIKSMPGIFRLSVDNLIKDIGRIRALGVEKVLLFGVASKKDEYATGAFGESGVVQRAARAIKRRVKGITVITDVCLCAYTTHGHCGILKNSQQSTVNSPQRNGKNRGLWTMDYGLINNDATLQVLVKIALSHAAAGADWVAPSAMAKRQVSAIRKALDKNGFKGVKIMGYSAKFASNFYGPFRDVFDSAPKFGDRSAYQLGFTDTRKALKEIEDDLKEGADAVMVKPALSYLDIIKEASQRFSCPLAAYNVSGEYAMVKKYCQGLGSRGQGIEKNLVLEILTGIRRAGADLIITYHAKDIARWLRRHGDTLRGLRGK